MSYEWTSCQCPVCGGPAEYNCVEDRVFCQRCKQDDDRLRDTLGEEEYAKIKARVELEERTRREERKKP